MKKFFECLKKWFVKKHNIDEMTVEEYNFYIKNLRKQQFKSTCNKLSKILDRAYRDYIKICKKDKIRINNVFFIEANEYGITQNDIDEFYNKKDVRIGNYKVSEAEFWRNLKIKKCVG